MTSQSMFKSRCSRPSCAAADRRRRARNRAALLYFASLFLGSMAVTLVASDSWAFIPVIFLTAYGVAESVHLYLKNLKRK